MYAISTFPFAQCQLPPLVIESLSLTSVFWRDLCQMHESVLSVGPLVHKSFAFNIVS